jgi:hypothetical protein
MPLAQEIPRNIATWEDRMTDPAMVHPCETSTPNRLSPPQVRLPKLVQGAAFAFFRPQSMRHWINRHGHIFEINVPSSVDPSSCPIRDWCG